MIGAVCAYSSEWKENGHKAAKKRGFYKYTKLKAKSLRDHEENKSKKYSVIKYKGLEEKMSLLVFFSDYDILKENDKLECC